MWTTCDQLFVVFVQDGHVHTIFRTETVVMQCRLFPNLVVKSLLHLTQERSRVTTRVGPVNVWVLGGIPFPRRNRDDAEVVQGCHRRGHWAPYHTPSGFLPHISSRSGPRTCDVDLHLSVPHFFALELKPSTKLIKRKPDSWVSVLTKMKMQDCSGACSLDPFPT